MIFVDCRQMINIVCIMMYNAQDIKFVENIIDFVEQRNNPFTKKIIATLSKILLLGQ